ncbi:MAG: hypothetical protein WA789_16290 [Candidatus Acidiferrum sp.]
MSTPANFRVTNWKPFSKKSLRGFFTLTLPSGMVLHQCSYFVKGDSRWIGLPSQKFTKKDGTVTYTPMVEFTSREVADKFRDQAVAALDLVMGSEEAS